MPEIAAKDFAAWLSKRLAEDTEIVRKSALEALVRGEAQAVRRTTEVGAVDQGQFRLAWNARARPDGAELRNDAPYAAVIERGRRPGRPGPPLAPIFAWVNRKLRGEIRGNYRFAKRLAIGLAKGGPGSRSFKRAAVAYVKAEFGPEERGVTAGTWAAAMNIRDAIHIRGTKPRWILRDTMRQSKIWFQREAVRRLRAKARGGG